MAANSGHIRSTSKLVNEFLQLEFDGVATRKNEGSTYYRMEKVIKLRSDCSMDLFFTLLFVFVS